MKHLLSFLLILAFLGQSSAQRSIEKKLRKKLPGVSLKKLQTKGQFSEAYEIKLPQYLDHENPDKGTFEQRIFLSHAGRKKPVVLNTQGYGLGSNGTLELSRMFDANQIQVEYRFHGKSQPEEFEWDDLTNLQASKDLHRIRKLFRKIYRKKWVSMGISKGGQTALIYRRFFPNDVEATVAYVAPMPTAREDLRTDEHQRITGDDACRQAITTFQKNILDNREFMLEKLKEYAKVSGMTFDRVGLEAALEYAVLEYPFSHWQWGISCELIPSADASSEELFTFLSKRVGFYLYSDKGIETYEPAFYQFLTELGYYQFYHDELLGEIKALQSFDNEIFGPRGVDLSHRPEFMEDILQWLDKNGNEIIYVYGSLDTWTACGVTPSDQVDAARFEASSGDHGTRIKNLSEGDQQKVVELLEKWTGLEVVLP